MKQVIIVRKDLNLSAGKLGAQVAHASVLAYKNTPKKEAEMWEISGHKKIVLKIQTETELLDIFTKAKKEKLPCSLIKDAGRTEIAPGTITCVGIGPAEDEIINLVVGNLKLY
ncbi:peptidyl-tRNA hydrolase [archaeon]|nr:peptidyl-tRNA hydrolase [archaeon]